MIRSLLIFGLFINLVFAQIDLNNPLPNWIDHAREKIDSTKAYRLSSPIINPPASFRLPAEYEPAQAVVIGYRGYTTMLREIARIAATEGDVEIWAASGPSDITGVDLNKYFNINCSLNTVWMRDYGPFGINEQSRSVAVVDSIYRHYQYRKYDDQLPTCLAASQGMESYGLDIILDGGNLMVDSKGNLFMTKRTYLWNSSMSKEEVDQRLKEYFNVHTIHAIDYAGYPSSPADGTGHIDMFVKLLDDNTVLITKTNDSPYKEACEKAANYFASIKAPNGKDYKIVRVKGWESGSTWYTYTNSLIVNNIVMIPNYSGHEQDNQAAADAYREGVPSIIVRGINSDSSISAGGSIHCVTQLIPRP